jgi:hypothetical protein
MDLKKAPKSEGEYSLYIPKNMFDKNENNGFLSLKI